MRTKETEGVDFGDGEAVERLRVRGAQCEDGVGPVFASVLGDVGTVVERDVRRGLPVGRGGVQVVVRLPGYTSNHCEAALVWMEGIADRTLTVGQLELDLAVALRE